MTKFSGLKEYAAKFKALSLSKKIQLVTAMLMTVILLVAAPVLAWFSYQRRVVKLQKIESPNSLFLTAAHREDSINLKVDGIDADEIMVDGNGEKILDSNNKEQKINHKYYVFNVTGEAVDNFTIQLAYTTNNRFTYEVYAAKELTSSPEPVSGQEIDYVNYPVSGKTVSGMPELIGDEYHLGVTTGWLYYQIDNSTWSSETDGTGKYVGTYLNSTDGKVADDDAGDYYYNISYGDYSGTKVQQDVKPVYWQATGVSTGSALSGSNKEAFSRHFILKVSWDSLDNNDKETDIVYITVK